MDRTERRSHSIGDNHRDPDCFPVSREQRNRPEIASRVECGRIYGNRNHSGLIPEQGICQLTGINGKEIAGCENPDSRIAPAVSTQANRTRNLLRLRCREIHCKLLLIHCIFHRLLLPRSDQKLFHIVFVSVYGRKPAVQGMNPLPFFCRDRLKLLPVEQVCRFSPVRSGKIGKMKEILHRPKTGLQRLLLHLRMKRNLVFSHVGKNPEASIQLISKRQSGSIQPVGNDLLRPGKNIGHQTHGRLRGQNKAICRPSLRSVNRKRTLICRSGNQIHINRICRKSKGSLSDMKFLSAHFSAFLILQHGVLPYVNIKCALFGIQNPAVCASRQKPPIPTLYYTISSPKSEARCRCTVKKRDVICCLQQMTSLSSVNTMQPGRGVLSSSLLRLVLSSLPQRLPVRPPHMFPPCRHP